MSHMIEGIKVTKTRYEMAKRSRESLESWEENRALIFSNMDMMAQGIKEQHDKLGESIEKLENRFELKLDKQNDRVHEKLDNLASKMELFETNHLKHLEIKINSLESKISTSVKLACILVPIAMAGMQFALELFKN